MKIAMIGHKRIPGREGGIEVVVEELSTRMAALGNDVTAYNRRSKKNKKSKKYKGIRLIAIPTIESKNLDAVIYSFLATIHSLFCHYDVIHYHGVGPSAFLLIPHFFGIHTVATVHGLNYKSPKWKGLGSKFMRFGEWIIAQYADEVIVLSKEQQNYFWDKYRRKTVLIPNGVNIQPISSPNIIQKKYGLKKDGYILFLSRLVPGKGLEYLIQAYKQIQTELPLIVAGDAPFVSDFIDNIKKKALCDSRIRFIGFVEGEELQELYSNAKLFVFPSEAEGMPLCLLEAMSYDVPCLVSDIPENKEIGKTFCRYFKCCDTEELKMELKKCIQTRCIFFNEEREYIEKKYNWNNAVRQTLSIYEKLRE